MGKVVLVGLLVAATGCGRYGFEPGDEPEPDAPIAPRQLTCGLSPKFSLGTTTLKDFHAVPTSTGFALFSIDTSDELRGWSYEWRDDTLAKGRDGAVLQNVTGAFGAAALGDDIVVAGTTGGGPTLATTYLLLDHELFMRTAPVTTPSRVIGAWPLARSGASNELATVRYENNDVAVQGISATGQDGSMRMYGVTAEAPSELSIVTAGSGYAVSWVDTAATPNQTKLALLDEYFAVVKGPITIVSGTTFDVIRPRVRWAPTSNTYGVTWFEKIASGDDDVYVAIFDDQLATKVAPMRVATSAVRPKIATDGNAFWLGYVNAKLGRMEVAKVGLDGSLAIRAAASGGGNPKAFGMVERAGQPVLVTVEESGGSQLYFDPLCD